MNKPDLPPEVSQFLDEIDRRAKALRIPISHLCQRAQMSPAAFTKWRSGHAMPSMRSMIKLRSALEAMKAELTAAE